MPTGENTETVVISVGGSLIVPDRIDTNFLTNLKELIIKETESGRRFIIICGGGKTARRYQKAAKELGGVSNIEVDQLGIAAIVLNVHLLRLIFNNLETKVQINPDIEKWKPGSSSDLGAIRAAKRIGAMKVINLSNIDYVMTSDPKKNKDAEKIEEITWSEFRKLIPKKWDPGLSSPFDPVAAREAESLDIEVAVINGDKLDELQKYLNGEPFVGTKISPNT